MGPLRKVQENLYTRPIRTKLFNLKLTKKQTLNQAINKVISSSRIGEYHFCPLLLIPSRQGRGVLGVGPYLKIVSSGILIFSCIRKREALY
jgi:hypothetical protein